MVKISGKRETPEDDVERLAEKIYNEYGNKIEDIDSFNKYFNKYMGTMKGATGTKLRKKVFENMIETHPLIIPKITPTSKKEVKKLPIEKVKPKFQYLRYVKNKIVYARKETLIYKIKKKEITRIIYRGKLGRFTSSKSLRERKGIKIHKVI